MILKLFDRLNDHWLIRYLQTSVIYIVIMMLSLIVRSIIAGNLNFEVNILIIFVLVLIFNFIFSIFHYFKLRYLYVTTSTTLSFASFSSILLATENFNGWEYFQATITLILFLTTALALGVVVHISMYLLTGKKSSETFESEQPFLKKIFISYLIILMIITIIIIFTVNPNIKESDSFNDPMISQNYYQNISMKFLWK